MSDRLEQGSVGRVQTPADACHGLQTWRETDNFVFSGQWPPAERVDRLSGPTEQSGT